MHVQNERNFPPAKLDSEMNVRFLLNGYGDLYFSLHNNSVHIVLLNLKENLKKYLSDANRPFPSSLVPLFQSESECETILMKMTLICMRMKLRAELVFI